MRISDWSSDVCSSDLGIWEKLPVASRKLQPESIIALVDELYPTLRWFFYDGLEHYSAPITIFGPTRAASYIGNTYSVFPSPKPICATTQHLDNLSSCDI